MRFVTSDYVMDPTTHAVRISGLKWERALIVVKYTLPVSIFSFYIFMATLRSRCGHYIFVLFVSVLFLSFFLA